MRFNLNDYVRVRLTDHGRMIHREDFEQLRAQCPNGTLRYSPPKEDAEGWSRWQMWNLMYHFGNAMGPGCDLPFEIDIILEVPDAPAPAQEGE